MFRRIPEAKGKAIGLIVDGRQIEARAGDTIAAALLAAGLASTRETPVSNTPRAPYCMMGVCFECVVTVDGVANRQGCLMPVSDGMVIETIKGARKVGA